MAIEGIKKAYSKPPVKNIEYVRPKPAKQVEINRNQYAGSKFGEVNQTGTMIKHRLQNTHINNAANGQTKNPYSDRTARTIANDRIDDYQKQGVNRQDSAEDTGRIIADIARYDPAKALQVSNIYLNDQAIENGHKDELSQEMTQALSDSDLQHVAKSEEGRQLLNEMKTHLLGGSAYRDEIADAKRIDYALTISAGYLSPKTFTSLDGIPAADAYISAPGTEVPQLTAEAVKDGNASFVQALDRHQDDAQWLNTFYQTLGTAETANQIQNASGLGQSIEFNKDLIGNSLQTLVGANLLNQTDLNALVGQVTTSENYFHAGAMTFLTDAITTLDNSADGIRTKNLYAESMAGIATGDIPIATQGTRDTEHAKDFAAAMATRTLASTPTDNQVSKLNSLRIELGGDFNGLIARAMKASTGEIYFPNGGNHENYSQVSELLESVAGSSDRYKNLRLQTFEAATSAINDGKIYENYQGNTQFKDALSDIFTRDFDALLHRGLYENGRFDQHNEDLTVAFENRISKFYEMALFTPPMGEKAGELINFVDNKYSEIADNIKNMSDVEFEDKYGRSRTVMSHAYGQMTGLLFKSMEDGLNAVRGNAEKEAEIWGTLFQVGVAATATATAAIPGAGIGVKLVSTGISQFLRSQYGDDVAGFVADGKYNDAINEMRKQGIDPHQLILDLYHVTYDDVLPDPGEPNADGVKDAWERGYSDIVNAPEVPFN